MKIAVIKLGSRIAVGSRGTSGGTGEVLSVIKILTNGGNDVTAFTKILSKDEKPTDFNIYNIEDYQDEINSMGFDALLVLNGNVNYFGGVDDPSQTLNYKVINNFEGKVFYVLCDAALLLNQIWKSVEKKPWGTNYSEKDINITRDDIIYICQARDEKKVFEKANKKLTIKDAKHFPFEKFPLLTLTQESIDFSKCDYDLTYGGTFRAGRREEDMIKFYFGLPEDIKVEMFGKIEDKHFDEKLVKSLRKPDFNDAVSYDEFPNRMKRGMATVIIGDELYKEMDNLAQRIYESIMIGNIVFIDSSYDYNKRVFKNEELVNFCYVKDRNDLAEKVRKIKSDEKFRDHIVNLQKSDTAIDLKEYSENLNKIIKG